MSQSARLQKETRRPLLSLLDRLIDDAPDQPQDPHLGQAEAMERLRRSTRRDLQALLNTRRRWRSWPTDLTELAQSAIGYGIADFSTGALSDDARRARLCAEIEETIRRFEPRFASVTVSEMPRAAPTDTRLRLRIDALLHAEPAPEPIAFEGLVHATTAEVTLRERNAEDV
ncbi:MAG: type VI secretion system baseplate subunit TssE [Proteobacteria bacterium]|nr:type VI secretion system baseplate subunit TssE [Pseudomonadota bacterium]